MSEVSGSTAVFAVIGHPVAHSRSPGLHNRWFAEHGVDAVYVALPVQPARASELVRALRTLGLAGVNLTVPFKEAVFDGLDRLGPVAEVVGAVNTVVRDGHELVGFNTDADGFVDGLVEAFGDVVSGAKVVVLGAGGAGLGVGYGLAARGASQVTWLNRTVGRAERVASRVGAACPRTHTSAGPLTPAGFRAVADADLVVCAVSGEGAAPVAALDVGILGDHAIWCDLNYWQTDPPQVEACRARGLRTQDGWPMLVHQAARAFEIFTGIRPDPRPLTTGLV